MMMVCEDAMNLRPCMRAPTTRRETPIAARRHVSGARHVAAALILAAFALFAWQAAAGASDTIIVQSTTSTQNAGFYRHVLPAFTADSAITVKVVAVGTGQALKNAQNCDGDMLIVHSREAEDAFIAAGYGAARYDLMSMISSSSARRAIPLVFAMPPTPAKRCAASSAPARVLPRAAMKAARIKGAGSLADDRHQPGGAVRQLVLRDRKRHGRDAEFSVQSGSYVLTDRATWLSFANKFRHRILFEGDPRLFNQYGIVTLDPVHCPTANHAGARRFSDWLRSPPAQELIGTLTRKGEQLFTPNAATR